MEVAQAHEQLELAQGQLDHGRDAAAESSSNDPSAAKDLPDPDQATLDDVPWHQDLASIRSAATMEITQAQEELELAQRQLEYERKPGLEAAAQPSSGEAAADAMPHSPQAKPDATALQSSPTDISIAATMEIPQAQAELELAQMQLERQQDPAPDAPPRPSSSDAPATSLPDTDQVTGLQSDLTDIRSSAIMEITQAHEELELAQMQLDRHQAAPFAADDQDHRSQQQQAQQQLAEQATEAALEIADLKQSYGQLQMDLAAAQQAQRSQKASAASLLAQENAQLEGRLQQSEQARMEARIKADEASQKASTAGRLAQENEKLGGRLQQSQQALMEAEIKADEASQEASAAGRLAQENEKLESRLQQAVRDAEAEGASMALVRSELEAARAEQEMLQRALSTAQADAQAAMRKLQAEREEAATTESARAAAAKVYVALSFWTCYPSSMSNHHTPPPPPTHTGGFIRQSHALADCVPACCCYLQQQLLLSITCDIVFMCAKISSRKLPCSGFLACTGDHSFIARRLPHMEMRERKTFPATACWAWLLHG